MDFITGSIIGVADENVDAWRPRAPKPRRDNSPLRRACCHPVGLGSLGRLFGRWRSSKLAERKCLMSMSEIADNKWEVQAAKAPVTSFSAICQVLLIVGFTGIFIYILQGSAAGIFGAKRDGGMTDNYGKMTNEASPKK
ncbi:hypothetical protein [Nannocystis sp.]|uniref:hypothetical protein n=1 Tax=Nannocystis sp. TaxID=1962667 RepID=UPI0025DE5B3A|nr:hypothetical protein [Nannocystis sp.]MBK7830702.1 hypothetical protein [Nannocystis sp.]